jgi:cell wall-associated NlpC family hydrolase
MTLRMKKIFFISIVAGVFSGISFSAAAQPMKTPRFIKGIEIVPGSYSGKRAVETNETEPEAEIKPTVIDKTTSDNIEKCTGLQFKYALLMNRDVESIQNLSLYNFIDGWMDTRYHYGGTDKDGIDCSAFTATLINKVYGFNIPRTAQEQYDVCQKLSKDDLLEGDLVFFNTRGGVSHVGIYLGDGYFVHSSAHAGVTINSLTDDYYGRKYIGGGRINQ